MPFILGYRGTKAFPESYGTATAGLCKGREKISEGYSETGGCYESTYLGEYTTEADCENDILTRKIRKGAEISAGKDST